jgi:hypothetical protein
MLQLMPDRTQEILDNPAFKQARSSTNAVEGKSMTPNIRWPRSILAGFLAMALVPTTDASAASTAKGVEVTSKPLTVEHICHQDHKALSASQGSDREARPL